MSEKKSRIADFEKSLAALEDLVKKLEAGDLPLEESLKQFERGVQLARSCQEALQQAELRVQQLIQPANGPAKLVDFDTQTE